MPFFKKMRVSTDKTSSKDKDKTQDNLKKKKVKKTKIGFKPKEKKEKRKENKFFKKKEYKKIDKKEVKTDEEKDNKVDKITEIEEDIFTEETKDDKKEKQWSSPKKKKSILKTDMKGKPVFLEDTGEKLGIVFDTIYDNEKHIVGYKIKDNKSDSILSFPIDQFDENKDGLIFIQGWYTNALKTLEKLEFKERVSPELTTLISDDEISNEELYNIFIKHDDQMANYIEEAISLKELLFKRLGALEKQRISLKDSLMDLTEKRLIKDIDRRQFSEDVMKHRRKVNVLDINIKKCKELIDRLNQTSFGRLGKYLLTNSNIDYEKYINKTQKIEKKDNITLTSEIESPYKEKYDNMKVQYDKLSDEYNELKSAVEKLISKGEL